MPGHVRKSGSTVKFVLIRYLRPSGHVLVPGTGTGPGEALGEGDGWATAAKDYRRRARVNRGDAPTLPGVKPNATISSRRPQTRTPRRPPYRSGGQPRHLRPPPAPARANRPAR